jgi:hypothetical protein
MHTAYCFAGQPTPCPGYFATDVLPCICGSQESLLVALSHVAKPSIPLIEVHLLPHGVHLLPLSA